MRFVGFDIETCTWPETGDWDRETPLGISCIGLAVSGEPRPFTYWAGMPGDPEPRKMNQWELEAFQGDLKMWLSHPEKSGLDENCIAATWNGLQFDFLMMALEHPQQKSFYEAVALNHIDPMFYVLCVKGYPVGLSAVAQGLGVKGKTEGMSGEKAPEMWMEGTTEDRLKVVEYVGQDAVATVDIVEAAIEQKAIKWASKKGNPMYVPYRPFTAKECIQRLPKPDTSWMTSPISRESFYQWIEADTLEREFTNENLQPPY